MKEKKVQMILSISQINKEKYKEEVLIKKGYITEDQPPLLNLHIPPEQQLNSECV